MFTFTEKNMAALKEQEEGEEEGDEEDDEDKVDPTPQKWQWFCDLKSYRKPKWDKDNGNGGPGGMGAGHGIPIA